MVAIVMDNLRIRPLDSTSTEEIALIADRMKKTLVDVMGEEKGSSYYPDDFFLERLKWHIDLKDHCELLVCELGQQIVAHAIVRVENDEEIHHKPFSYFSTIYTAPEWRRRGLARQLIEKVHEWSLKKSLDKITYSTAKNHHGLISLFEEFGYNIIVETDEMVRMAKELS